MGRVEMVSEGKENVTLIASLEKQICRLKGMFNKCYSNKRQTAGGTSCSCTTYACVVLKCTRVGKA